MEMGTTFDYSLLIIGTTTYLRTHVYTYIHTVKPENCAVVLIVRYICYPI